MSGALMSLLIVESALTAAVIVMFLYRGMLDLKEEDHVILDDAEAHLAREQAAIRVKVTMLSKYLRVISIVWVVLALVIFVLWILEGLDLL